jgi:hypothetical protein
MIGLGVCTPIRLQSGASSVSFVANDGQPIIPWASAFQLFDYLTPPTTQGQ